MTNISIIGTTAWGTTLALLSANAGNITTLLARNENQAQELDSQRENKSLLPEAIFPDNLNVASISRANVSVSDIMIFAVPSVTIRENLHLVASTISDSSIIVSATKGIEVNTGKRMTQVITDILPNREVGVLSGPNLASEIAKGKPASATVAFKDIQISRLVQDTLGSDRFRVYSGSDVTGVELGGALKNIIAIGAGFIDKVGLGNNAKAAFITRGLHEITRLGVSMGAEQMTFAGLTGMGDLITTCYSPLSRNYRLGQRLATGEGLQKALENLGSTAEGVPTTRAAIRLSRELNVEMPITETTNAVLDGILNPKEAIPALMKRAPQPESLI
mgnify:CR=1 FL=1